MPSLTLNDRRIASLKPTTAQRDYFDKALPGFGVRVNPTGRKTFVLLHRVNGKLQRLTLRDPLVTEFVYLRGGLTVPLPALELALALEQRGYRQSVDAHGEYQIEPANGLSEGDRARITCWRLHLGAIVSYGSPEVS